MLAAGLFLAALFPTNCAPSDEGCANLRLNLVPAHPVPGETVHVHVYIEPAYRRPQVSTWGYIKQISVDGGTLSALRRDGVEATPARLEGPTLKGDLSCISWTLPDKPGQSRIVAAVGGQQCEATVGTAQDGPLRVARAQEWLSGAMNLCHRLGVR